MQLSTSFLPFDVAPAAAPVVAAAGASAPSQSAPGDFDAILTSEANLPATAPSNAAALPAGEPVDESGAGNSAEVGVIVANAPDQPAQTPAIAPGFSWSGFVTPPDASVSVASEVAGASAGTASDSELSTQFTRELDSSSNVGRGITAQNQPAASAPSRPGVVQAFVSTSGTPAQPTASPSGNSANDVPPSVPATPSAASSRANTQGASLDSNPQPLPLAPSELANQTAASLPASAPAVSVGKESNVADTTPGGAASTLASAGVAPKAEAPPSPKTETHSAQPSGATSHEPTRPFSENDPLASRSHSSAPATPRDARALDDAVSSETTSVTPDDVAAGASATSAAVSEKRVRTLVEATHAGTPRPAVDGSLVGDHTAARAVAEKFAAPGSRRERFSDATSVISKKETVAAAYQTVTDRTAVLGTNVAKAEDHMSSPASIAAPAHSVERLSHAVAPASFDTAFAAGGGEESSELAQVARRAVNAAMEITEQFATGEKNHVTLKFSISGSELGVRVELRGEQVHTTFRTDSPELRAALAQEWNVVNAPAAGDRASRLAEPVFASNSSSGAAGSDTSGADQRGSQARQSPFAGDEFARYRPSSRAADNVPAAVPTPVSRPVSAVAPGRLHTFA